MEPAAYSIIGFCTAHDISRSQFYKIDRQGIGPRKMRIGSRTLISREAAADWRREREAVTANSPKPVNRPRGGYAADVSREPVDTTATRVV